MTLGQDILKAVKAGGSDNWRPQCEITSKARKPARNPRLEPELIKLYETIGNDRLSCTQWAERMGCRRDLVRCRAEILIRQGKIKRTTGLMPFLYYRA